MAQRKTKALARLRLSLQQIGLIDDMRESLGTLMRGVYDELFDDLFESKEQGRAWSATQFRFAAGIVAQLSQSVEAERDLLKAVLECKGPLLKEEVDRTVDGLLADTPERDITKRKVDYARKRAISLLCTWPKRYKDKLSGTLQGMTYALAHFRRVSPDKLVIERPDLDKQHKFIKSFDEGMKALRLGWNQLYFATHAAGEVQQIRLSREQSADWYRVARQIGEPPTYLIRDIYDMAQEEGRVFHVYDDRNEFLYAVHPTETFFEQEYYVASLGGRAKPKARWEFSKRDPDPVRTFAAQLTPAQQRKATDMLKARGQMSIRELSRELKVPYHGMGWQAAYQANPQEAQRIANLHHAVWSMDLSD